MSITKQKTIMRAFACFSLWLVLLLPITACKSSGSSNSKSSNANPTIFISPGAAVLSAAQTQQFTATVTNASNTRVTWSIVGCTSGACGTISSAGLYTAPSVIPYSDTVIIQAISQANSVKYARTNIALLPLTVAISDDSIVLAAGESHQFTATVTRHSNTAVTWTLSPGCDEKLCGTISNSGLYTSPSSIQSSTSIGVYATSLADPTKSDSVSVSVWVISVSIAPRIRVVPPGTTRDFTATVQYDIKKAGVTWSLGANCAAAKCGTLTNISSTSVTYTAPAESPDPSEITLYAKSVTNPSKSSAVAFSISATSQLKEGDYVFYYNGFEKGDWWFSSAASIAVAGRFHADGHGNITNGIEDRNLASGIFQSVAFTGTYDIGMDNRGSFIITTDSETSTFYMTVDPSGTKGKFIKFDALPGDSPILGNGYFEMQDKAALSLSVLAGQYAIRIASWQYYPTSTIGRFTADTSGKISDGRMDVAVYTGKPNISLNLGLSGSMSEPSPSTGRGTASVTLTPKPSEAAGTMNFAYYIISDQKVVLVQTDARTPEMPAMWGEMQRQNGPFSLTSLNAPIIFHISGESFWGPVAAVGRMVPDGSNSLTGAIDMNSLSFIDETPTLNQEFFGNYSVEPNGRSTITLNFGSDSQSYVAYLISQNQGYLMQTDGPAFASVGGFRPQADQPFASTSVSGAFLTNTMMGTIFGEKASGVTTFDSAGMVTSSLDIAGWSDLAHFDFIGMYAVAANGRGTIEFNEPTSRKIVFWAISPSELIAISTVNPDDYSPGLMEYNK
jgi:hypothetical protein